jgi:hypothetical protein
MTDLLNSSPVIFTGEEAEQSEEVRASKSHVQP